LTATSFSTRPLAGAFFGFGFAFALPFPFVLPAGASGSAGSSAGAGGADTATLPKYISSADSASPTFPKQAGEVAGQPTRAALSSKPTLASVVLRLAFASAFSIASATTFFCFGGASPPSGK
jgi:hypothetical protein